MQYKYEKKEQTFMQGDIIHNFNGSDYHVVEKYSERNLLLMNLKTGEFVVANDVYAYARYPKHEGADSNHTEYGIEWGHGIYLAANKTNIDYGELRQLYGVAEVTEYEAEIKEVLSRVEKIKAENLGEAIDKAMELYDGQEIVLDAEDMKGVDFIPFENDHKKVKESSR